MAIAALSLFPSLDLGDTVALLVVLAWLLVALALLNAGGRLRLGQIVAMCAIGAVAVGYLVGLASVRL